MHQVILLNTPDGHDFPAAASYLDLLADLWSGRCPARLDPSSCEGQGI